MRYPRRERAGPCRRRRPSHPPRCRRCRPCPYPWVLPWPAPRRRWRDRSTATNTFVYSSCELFLLRPLHGNYDDPRSCWRLEFRRPVLLAPLREAKGERVPLQLVNAGDRALLFLGRRDEIDFGRVRLRVEFVLDFLATLGAPENRDLPVRDHKGLTLLPLLVVLPAAGVFHNDPLALDLGRVGLGSFFRRRSPDDYGHAQQE